ncbi:kynureninase [Williamsia sterculiae]|uniref:Kynureninase n=1 Tax=Williamsia sterculiae TaxID=1344003 RepID=A0A1N7DRP0_9NOCA|nr:aminotransferase class V-fold PLP-dependent enzyme [Williamsia sterculiae]SIR78355.1 Kynureninase [Williamsia sterculiae]
MTEAGSDRARVLDAEDPLHHLVDEFVAGGDVIAYLDGNSLGRPTRNTAGRVRDFIDGEWGGRLIRGWDESWFELPLTLGDRIGEAVVGAAPGQTVVGDSTTVLLYKLARAAWDLNQGRTEIVIDRDNFPTDRYLIEGIAAETGATVRWIDAEPRGGVTADDLDAVVGEQTALVVLSQVAYRSGHLLDVPAVVEVCRRHGALLLLDICHSAGAVEVGLDAWGVDLAVGCSYKYLNGGPGSPAVAYVARRHLERIRPPIWGWMGAAASFEMVQGYTPAAGIRRILSGTPPIYAMLPMMDMLDLIESATVPAIRAKSVTLTEFAIDLVDGQLADLGVTVASPRDPRRRGGHITIDHPAAQAATGRLWERGVIPDFRHPNGIRLGFSPLSTTFGEVAVGIAAVGDELRRAAERTGM